MAMLSIEISDENYQKLEKLVQGTGVSVADTIRMLVDKSFNEASLLEALDVDPEVLKAEDLTFHEYLILRHSVEEGRRPDAPGISQEEFMARIESWAAGNDDFPDEPDDGFALSGARRWAEDSELNAAKR